MLYVEKIFFPLRHRIVESIMPDWKGMDDDDASVVKDDVTSYIVRALALAPFHVRLGIAGLDMLFILFALICAAVTRQPLDLDTSLDRWARIAGLTATHARFYRSMSYLVAFEHPLVLPTFGIDSSVKHVQAFRAKRDALLAEGGQS